MARKQSSGRHGKGVGSLGITSEAAKKLVQADLQTLLQGSYDPETKKLTKPLPAGVRRMLVQVAMHGDGDEAPVSTQAFVQSKVELAKALGISRPTLDTLFKKKGRPTAESDGRYSVADWKAFATKHGIQGGRRADNEDEPEMSPREAAITQRILQKMEMERFRWQVEQRLYIKREEADATIEAANAVTTRELYKVFLHELPARCEGKTAAEIRALNKDRLDSVLQRLPRKITGLIGNG